MGTVAVNTPAKFSDEGTLYDEIYGQIKAALAPLGAHDAIEQIARGGADYAVRQYMSEVQNGVAVGVARQNAVSTGKVWADSEAKKHGVAPAGPPVGPADTSVVNVADIQQAVDAYRTGVQSGQEQRQAIIDYRPTPTAQGTQTPVQAATVSEAQRLQAAMQGQTTVGSADLAGLQASAQGQGAVGQLAAARLQQALRAGAAQASGIAQGATGAARKGALRTAALAANRNAMDAGAKTAEMQAAGAIQAQTQVAGLQQQRANLQGQLDQARAAGDQQAINSLQAKMADLDQQTKQFNAGQTQTAATTRNDQALAAQGQDENQRVANERLKLDAQGAIENSAKGLLDEAQREATLSMARQQLDLAERRFQLEADEAKKAQANQDRMFWASVISNVAGGLVGAISAPPTPPGPPKAAHGGLVTKPTEVLVGEAGPELIVPVNQDVGARLARALSVGAQPFDRQGAPDLSALLALLKGGQGQPAPAELPPELVALLAAGNARARKASY
jgi:hypothetical protein